MAGEVFSPAINIAGRWRSYATAEEEKTCASIENSGQAAPLRSAFRDCILQPTIPNPSSAVPRRINDGGSGVGTAP